MNFLRLTIFSRFFRIFSTFITNKKSKKGTDLSWDPHDVDVAIHQQASWAYTNPLGRLGGTKTVMDIMSLISQSHFHVSYLCSLK